MVKILNTSITGDIFTTAHPYDLAAKSTDVLPAGCPMMTRLFVVDKMDVIVCDGEDNWYREADNPKPAGQFISILF